MGLLKYFIQKVRESGYKINFLYLSLLNKTMAKDKQSMPMSTAGLTRYFDESPEAVKLKPEHVVAIIISLIVIEVFLHLM